MEHRWGKRCPLDLRVTLHLGSGAVVPGRIANVSLSGALVRTGASVPSLSRVVVDLDAGAWHLTRPRLVPAYAVRDATGEVALEWTEFSPPAVFALLADRGSEKIRRNATSYPDQHPRPSTALLRGGQFERRPWG
jgi:hypothetical protein